MRISARCDYACKALLELTFHWPNKGPVQVHTISERQDIPMKYLVQILLQLKRIGLVESIRGKQGGYTLAEAPNKIRLGEVMREIEGPLLPRHCAQGRGLPVVNTAAKRESVFATIWEEVEEAMADVLDKITFEDIANKAKGVKGAIVYQI